MEILGAQQAEVARLLDPRALLTALADGFRALTSGTVDADVVALATHAGQAVVQPEWIRPGAHVSSVGYRPPVGELPTALARDQRLFVETRLAFAPPPAGCAELAGLDPRRATELGEVLLGTHPGRAGDDEITVYNAMGHVIEDIVAAELVVAAARETGTGLRVPL